MIYITMPNFADTGMVEEVFDKSASRSSSAEMHEQEGSSTLPTYGAKGSENVEWKWFSGPFPWPSPGAVLMPASTYLDAALTDASTSIPLARLDAMAAACLVNNLSRA